MRMIKRPFSGRLLDLDPNKKMCERLLTLPKIRPPEAGVHEVTPRRIEQAGLDARRQDGAFVVYRGDNAYKGS